MPALNFKKQFADAVESGTKRQTIRALRADGRDPERGSMLHLYTGMRTKGCRKIGQVPCTGVKRIGISQNYIVRIDGEIVGDGAALLLARRDGFDTLPEFFNFFETTHGLPFFGLLIEW